MSKSNSLYIKSARCQSVERPPIWIMRQAGRYMQAYQNTRKNYSFMEIMGTPEIAAEVTLQPIKEFGFDAAIMFSDILITAQALGSDLDFVEGKGPIIHNPVESQDDINQLNTQDAALKFGHVATEIGLIQKELEASQTPLIGFCGAPFTVASYMVGEGHGHNVKTFKQFMYHEPTMCHSLLQKLTDISVDYLNIQIKAGVDALQIFDSWSNVLSWTDFQEFSLPYIKQILDKLENPENIPITLFGLGNTVFYPLLQDLGVQVLGMDWTVDISRIRKEVSPDIALQGNLDPYILLAPKDLIETRTNALLNSMKNTKGFIMNLGHGITPDIPEENVRFLVDLVKSA